MNFKVIKAYALLNFIKFLSIVTNRQAVGAPCSEIIIMWRKAVYLKKKIFFTCRIIYNSHIHIYISLYFCFFLRYVHIRKVFILRFTKNVFFSFNNFISRYERTFSQYSRSEKFFFCFRVTQWAKDRKREQAE